MEVFSAYLRNMRGATARSPSLRWKRFSCSDKFMEHLDDDWVAAKDAGNALLKRRDYVGARAQYDRARLITIVPLKNGGLEALLEGLESWPAD